MLILPREFVSGNWLWKSIIKMVENVTNNFSMIFHRSVLISTAIFAASALSKVL